MAFAAVAAVVAIVASLAAAGVSAYAQKQQGETAAKAARYNAKVQENAAIEARQAGKARAADVRERGRRLQAAALARYGASGVALEGSPGDVLIQNARDIELDAQRAQYSAEAEARAHDAEKVMQRFKAKNYETAGYLGAGATLLTGIGNSAGYAGRLYNTAPSASTGAGGGIGYGSASTPPPGNYPY